ncbi:hypothetical protein BRADI_4g07423v3 [Brachypodium distachyon]|uniref:Uncharacterized protein n=1 Tax=Brachypodium distachyon TaxID=15368 RepID=A0A2K2CL06_BRADI|nr:hypothetical protein BRADI_4g07423v3 [Brachypodium distachyon]
MISFAPVLCLLSMAMAPLLTSPPLLRQAGFETPTPIELLMLSNW